MAISTAACFNSSAINFQEIKCVLTLEALRGGQIDPPSIFLALNFLLLDRLSKALAQLFLVCEHIF